MVVIHFRVRVRPQINQMSRFCTTVGQPRDSDWLKQHLEFVEYAKEHGHIDVLFLGDSITDLWRKEGHDIWERNFAPLNAANFGVSGDRTQHLLWRLQNGALDYVSPRIVVLMIGTNNTGWERDNKTVRNTPAEVVAGIMQCVAEIRQKLPNSQIILFGILPRNDNPNPEHNQEQAAQIREINNTVQLSCSSEHISFTDVGDKFMSEDETSKMDLFIDGLHLSTKGYETWAQALLQHFARFDRAVV